MSRSRRKTPVCGIACADSDKRDKVFAHHSERRGVRVKLEVGDFDDIPSSKALSDSLSFSKDGKMWFDPKRFPALMRK